MSYQTTILARSPTLYLPMTELSGTLVDATGHGHDATVPFGTTAIVGGADSFLTGEKATSLPDHNAYLEFAIGSGWPTFGAFTLDFWMKMLPSADQVQFDFVMRATEGVICELAQDSPTTLAPLLTWQPGGQIETLASPTVPYFNCWHYWAFTFDALGTITLYLDGQPVQTLTDGSMAGVTFTPDDVGRIENNRLIAGAPFDLAHVAFYPAALSASAIAANYAAATPRQDADCFPTVVRLFHADGTLDWQHDKTTFKVFSDGVEHLRTPIPVAGSPPKRFVGIDPAGTLAVHDILPVTATHSIAPVVPPTPPATTPTTCDQMRCGAATNMANHLISLYDHWAGVLNPLSSIAIKLGVGAAIAAGGELIVSAFALEELAAAIFESITSKLTSLLSAATVGLFDSPTPDEQTVIINGAYCALTCDGNVIDPTAAQIQGWNNYLAAHSASFSALNMQLALYNALLDFTPLLDWQLQAQSATPNPSCGTMTCP